MSELSAVLVVDDEIRSLHHVGLIERADGGTVFLDEIGGH